MISTVNLPADALLPRSVGNAPVAFSAAPGGIGLAYAGRVNKGIKGASRPGLLGLGRAIRNPSQKYIPAGKGGGKNPVPDGERPNGSSGGFDI